MDDDGLMMTMMLMMEMTMTATMKAMRMTTTMTLRVRKSIGRPSVIQAEMKNNLEARPHWLQCPRGKVNMIKTNKIGDENASGRHGDVSPAQVRWQ
jgi:hypothetical protein